MYDKTSSTENWLKEKAFEYGESPKETLQDMLATANDVMLQYMNNPKSKAAKELLNICIEHNTLFLTKICTTT